jgi:LPS sulfotransferase NodH
MNQHMEDPFFIVGCGRSGTTLLRTLLNGHPDIGVPQESLFITDYLRADGRVAMTTLRKMLIREPELEEWGIKPTLEDLDACNTPAEAIDRLHRIYLTGKGKHRWGQKTPRFVRFVGLLHTHFPGARFIHVVRDPRAVVSSLISSDVHRSNALYASRRWLNDVGAGIEAERDFPQQVIRVRYEDLVTDVETTLSSIASFLRFDYDAAMVAAAAQGAAEYSRFYAAIHANLSLPPTDQFINKWKDRLSPSEVCLVESITGPRMLNLGYVPSAEASPTPPTHTMTMRLERGLGLVRQSTQYLRFRRKYLFYLILRKWRLGLMGDFLRGVNY